MWQGRVLIGVGSAPVLQCRVYLHQPEAHSHLAVHRGGGGQVLVGFRRVARRSVKPAGRPGAPAAPALARVSRAPRPRARWRSAIVPKPAPADAQAAAPGPRRWPWARLRRRVFRDRGPRVSPLRRPAADPRRGDRAPRRAAVPRGARPGRRAAARAAGLARLTRRGRRPPRDAVVPVCPPPVRRLEGGLRGLPARTQAPLACPAGDALSCSRSDRGYQPKGSTGTGPGDGKREMWLGVARLPSQWRTGQGTGLRDAHASREEDLDQRSVAKPRINYRLYSERRTRGLGGAGTLAASGRESRRNGTSARTSTVQRLRGRSVET